MKSCLDATETTAITDYRCLGNVTHLKGVTVLAWLGILYTKTFNSIDEILSCERVPEWPKQLICAGECQARSKGVLSNEEKDN